MMKFSRVIKSLIKDSGGSIDKVNLDKFMDLMNGSFIFNPCKFNPWNYWLGVRILKSPLDLVILQEIMFETRPDTIIECGTCFGGSSYYMATMMDLMNIDGKIITIDVYDCPPQAYHKKDFIKIGGKTLAVDLGVYELRTHPKIERVISNCLTADIPKLGERTMVVLDCDHTAAHVYAELEKYSQMVSLGQYMIVEDAILPDKRNGPAAAIKKFLSQHKNFVADKTREKFGISSNPGGYLLRIS